MNSIFCFALIGLLLVVGTSAICTNTYQDCPELRDQAIADWLTGLDPSLDPIGNPWQACISSSAMNSYYSTYYNANNGKVPFGSSGTGFLNLCKVSGQYCYNQMKATCNCMSTCTQVSASQGMVAAN
jgi:hypothetical protein